jgi:hypothetical protein
MTKMVSLSSFISALSATLIMTAPAIAGPVCETTLVDGKFKADFVIEEFYPGSDLHRQNIRIEAQAEKLALSQEERMATLAGRDVGKVKAVAYMENTKSLKNKDILRDKGWNKLDLDLTLIRLTAGKWYHRNCRIETENYIIEDALPFKGDYKSTCSLNLHEEAVDVLSKEKHLDWKFFGDNDWKPLYVRINLDDFNAFREAVETESSKQLDSYKKGACDVKTK